MQSVAISLAALIIIIFSQNPANALEQLLFSHQEIEVIDGDTFMIGETIYQLAGIDAPEIGQICIHNGNPWDCGESAYERFKKLAGMQSKPIACFPKMTEEKIREVSCFIGDKEISDILLKGGSVVAKPDAEHHYLAIEHQAKQGHLGIWGSRMIMPWLWRKGERILQ